MAKHKNRKAKQTQQTPHSNRKPIHQFQNIKLDQLEKSVQCLQSQKETAPEGVFQFLLAQLNISKDIFEIVSHFKSKTAKIRRLEELGILEKSESSRSARQRNQSKPTSKMGHHEEKLQNSSEKQSHDKFKDLESEGKNKPYNSTAHIKFQEITETIKADREPLPHERIIIEERFVYDISTTLVRKKLLVETIVDKETGERDYPKNPVAASGMNHSYQLIEFFAYQHVCLMLPFYRMSQYYGSGHKSFSSSQLYQLLHFQAEALAGVYLYLWEYLLNKPM